MFNLDSFSSVKIKRKKPDFKNATLVDDVFERDRVFHSFAIQVRYIGKESKTELREYLWGPDGKMNPEILKGAEFESTKEKSEFKIPAEIIEEIRARGEKEEAKFHRELEKERREVIAHLKRVLEENMREEKYEEVERIKAEIERRERAEFPELVVKIEPVALLEIHAPVEIHHSRLKNEFADKELTWEFDTLTGEHDLKCEGCGKSAMGFYLTVDGISCESCLKVCKECGKPMIHAKECKVCHAPLCDEHVHYCSTCHGPICSEHATKCRFCSKEMCPEHVNRCSVCNAPLCEEHTYHCSVCGSTIGPMHVRVCDVCGSDVCPEHIHKCAICGKNVCENCAVELDGKWYCKEHLERSYGGKWVIPEVRCKICGVALANDEINRCSVCDAPLCDDHTNHCSVCDAPLCDEHTNYCSICNAPLCDKHVFISEMSGKEYCEEHSLSCKICGRIVGEDELKDGVCRACSDMVEVSRRDIPREIMIKFPYSKHGKRWFVSQGKNVAYITEVKGVILAYRIVNGEIVEHRGKR